MTLTDDQARALRAHYDRLKASGYSGLKEIEWIEEIVPREAVSLQDTEDTP